jgi:hypothetical protein
MSLTRTDPNDRDGVWDKEEIEAVYGVHHVYNKKKSKVRGCTLASWLHVLNAYVG